MTAQREGNAEVALGAIDKEFNEEWTEEALGTNADAQLLRTIPGIGPVLVLIPQIQISNARH